MMMKYYIFLISFFTLFNYSYSQTQTTIPGYYITNTNDTVIAQIKLPHYIFSDSVRLIKFIEKVEIIDSLNRNMVFRVNDIKGFGFLFNNNRYIFLSKDFGRENAFSASTHRFYQAIFLGQKTSLYHRLTTLDQSGRKLGIMYFLENADGANQAIYLFARTKPEFIKSLLKKFYKDNLEAQTLIDSKFQSKFFEAWQNDIMEIVQNINKL